MHSVQGRIMAPALVLQGITKSFGPVRALRGVSLTVDDGEALAVFGPNGAGKTTLLKIAATLMRPTAGRVLVRGMDPGQQAPRLRRLIGLVSHHSYLYPGLSGYENLLFAARMYGVPGAPGRVRALLEAVGLAGRGDDLVRTYSRGMAQRLSIARALVHDPPILLLDEPYTGLDRQAAAGFTDLLRAMRGTRTIVLTTHSIEQGVALSDRVAILVDGTLAYEADNGARDVDTVERVYAQCVGEPA
ncbi:MAG: ABC transporter ATP-binding protein [Armatimonadota bacterium]|nr:ABC transporter ATP-binding protein [Armatimonadota bacterium]MDR7451445.1 ABC transporter ATP-binding protein [Armatimonadota bacterium]MDR7466405.1 ABC transporter ATP-binding protein [Armatimonadota bacterium]MDR7493127.1 ABC transporter ATP-binding protein [Armatimonadota bacterium]MDR7498116.1 ABC transporter ATP-binding protein [Armatimonadota bacterium]